jgi:hypothetical protein
VRLTGLGDDEYSGPASNWVDPDDSKQWRAMLDRLRTVLAPPPSSLPLFDTR